ncbi:FAD-linked oxidase C-terminal domain-containing protein [Microbacterium sp. KSW4-17]|uniref:FAD-linked oxidase C-terminal domain-containing protein n=1 Tax=Microbacterium galbum TaxID=3075994 RepID=A0ABU3T5M8_9MICO|nr:FAD-linked oxidase C-terminal domain-containing protein [Microbacterium sp. KSW4-17]MDU0366679.1 FAD-linked oxidase C-terminal domain-containing protein [Microbacterium sp. KSW4-17]
MSTSAVVAPLTGLPALLDAVREVAPHLDVRAPSAATAPFAFDAGTVPRHGEADEDGPAVSFPSTVSEVQQLVRLAGRHGVSIVARGAGSGLSGGASATRHQLVVSTDRLDRIVEVSPADEVAVVEPGVLNAALNERLAPLGLFYAPDPASWRISTIGGNIATNAGGLRCAKYGVTRESVLALDVVLADGSLVSIGHRSIKGVTGLDLVSLFVGSEGVLGIVVGATVRIRPLPVARRTVTAFFDSTAAGAAGIGAITASRVRPSVIEFLDEPTLVGIDAAQESGLRARGAALLLIELDGFGIDEQTAELTVALESAGARVRVESDADAETLWELRRSGRRFDDDSWFVGGDVAVPKSRIAEVFAGFPALEERYGVAVSAVAHAGDGNLHPVITLPIPAGADPAAFPAVLHDAADDLVRAALAVGGTVSGEHGIGTVKRELAAEELAERVRVAQLAIKDALDPTGLFNPGKAL